MHSYPIKKHISITIECKNSLEDVVKNRQKSSTYLIREYINEGIKRDLKLKKIPHLGKVQ